MRRFGLLLGLLALGGCMAHAPKREAVVTVDAPPLAAWRTIAVPDDQASIDSLATQWDAARSEAARRYPTRLRIEGPLLDPAGAQPLPALPPGTYQCRLVRLGARPAYIAYRPDTCVVDGDDKAQSLTKQDGTTLPGGWLFSDEGTKRLIFLGTNRTRPQDAAPPYGAMPGHNVVGVVERIGVFRWRLVLAKGGGPSGALDVLDLVPLPPSPPTALPPTAAPVSERAARVPRG
ncbi:MAG: DUF4893 domain-containing protein [Sphingomonas sp.]|nr:DUF4893 domain-containing protein [Sphingomonas sp.]